jgi:hypothetical protein
VPLKDGTMDIPMKGFSKNIRWPAEAAKIKEEAWAV